MFGGPKVADSSFGLKIGLEGEREFKRAISDISREMRVLGSELKLAATSFDGTDKSAAALTARSAGLVREINNTSQKLGLSREGFQEWSYILRKSGTSIDVLGIGMKTLQKTMGGMTEDGDSAS